MQSSQTLLLTAPVHPRNSRFSQAPLKLSKVLSDSARAFPGDTESTCSSGGTFRMLWDLTYRIVRFWSSWDLCTRLRRRREQRTTSVQLCGRLNAVFWQQWFMTFHNHKAFCVSDSSLLQSQDSLHHNMACILYLSHSIYIHTANLTADGTGA